MVVSKKCCRRERRITQCRPPTIRAPKAKKVSRTRPLSVSEAIELRKLLRALPSVAKQQISPNLQRKNNVSSVCASLNCVVEYINQLEATVIARVQNGSLHSDAMHSLVCQQNHINEKGRRKTETRRKRSS
ncbi:hypothetical protein AB6A40_003783 [Gnathostoma spinigerum]|uniref:BHLH domain-containing protein n=1 Tax=Gnathostoma spinigerum TaxID=75299 RepID=A0ABD6EIB0_9BILA